MRLPLQYLACALLTSTVFASTVQVSAQEAVARVGEPAPDFNLVDENGVSHTLSQYLGNVVVLEWTNPDCPFVVRCYESQAIPETVGAFAELDAFPSPRDRHEDGTQQYDQHNPAVPGVNVYQEVHGGTLPSGQEHLTRAR